MMMMMIRWYLLLLLGRVTQTPIGRPGVQWSFSGVSGGWYPVVGEGGRERKVSCLFVEWSLDTYLA